MKNKAVIILSCLLFLSVFSNFFLYNRSEDFRENILELIDAEEIDSEAIKKYDDTLYTCGDMGYEALISYGNYLNNNFDKADEHADGLLDKKTDCENKKVDLDQFLVEREEFYKNTKYVRLNN